MRELTEARRERACLKRGANAEKLAEADARLAAAVEKARQLRGAKAGPAREEADDEQAPNAPDGVGRHRRDGVVNVRALEQLGGAAR